LTSQIPVDHWHEIVGDATFGDAILDAQTAVTGRNGPARNGLEQVAGIVGIAHESDSGA
jgi:hypothetical protein